MMTPCPRICAGVLALTGALYVAGAGAADTKPSGLRPMPEVLKNAQPAGSQCRPDEEQGSAPLSAASPVKTARADLACAVDVPKALPLLNQEGTLLMDVRPAVDYGRGRIPGAMNVTFDVVRNRTYWRDKTVVLYGSGKGERELLEHCARLKSEGFRSLRVLRGGMAAWLANGQAIEGASAPAESVARLDAGELWRESRFESNLLIATRAANVQREFPMALQVKEAGPAEIKAAVAGWQKKHKKTPFASVILIAGRGLTAQEIADAQKALAPVPLLAYVGTRDSLLAQKRVQEKVTAAYERGPKKPRCGM